MRDHIAPELRELGFKGSGGSFVLDDPEHWATIGFQRDRYSDRVEVRFTVNLQVVSRSDWQAARSQRGYLPERPAANTTYGRLVWWQRLGELLPVGRDVWWKVGPGTDLPALASEVLAAIRDYGLPAMRAQLEGGGVAG